ncbi:unnamed protein product [Rodentolepis nana]|uniref:FERM domain-containing protein n=1 Tax=Rodentolepis nana TaxID=102285 RepID=A0A0R3TS76_RODNA|nr:unnamed protein product [Rodentolepis nana]
MLLGEISVKCLPHQEFVKIINLDVDLSNPLTGGSKAQFQFLCKADILQLVSYLVKKGIFTFYLLNSNKS